MPQSDAGAPVEVDQLRLSVTIEGSAVGTSLAPEIADGTLNDGEALILCFARDDGGASVLIEVEGLWGGAVVGTGTATVTLEAGAVVSTSVPLT